MSLFVTQDPDFAARVFAALNSSWWWRDEPPACAPASDYLAWYRTMSNAKDAFAVACARATRYDELSEADRRTLDAALEYDRRHRPAQLPRPDEPEEPAP